MFLKSFIELLALYKNIYNNANDKLANETYMTKNTTRNNLYYVDNDIMLCNLYLEFIQYYDNWYITFFKN
jgi:hypothetical protein